MRENSLSSPAILPTTNRKSDNIKENTKLALSDIKPSLFFQEYYSKTTMPSRGASRISNALVLIELHIT